MIMIYGTSVTVLCMFCRLVHIANMVENNIFVVNACQSSFEINTLAPK